MLPKKKTSPRKAGANAKPAPTAERHRVFRMPFSRIYAAWLNKVERKQRSQAELDQVIRWLTGYTTTELRKWAQGQGHGKGKPKGESERDLGTFFDLAPAFNPAAELIRGTVCGVRVEEVAEPSMRQMRQLDKLIDELAQGKPMAKILRQTD
jgi:hypothetical protein